MKVLIRRLDDVEWLDVTKFVNGSLAMSETRDGTFNTLNFNLLMPSRYEWLDGTKALPPKLFVKLTESDDEIEGVNTFYFLTSDNNSYRERRKNDNHDSLYTHELNCQDIIHFLDNKYLPNYTITQPKTEFYSTYIKSAGVDFNLGQRIQQDGNPIILNEGIRRDLSTSNNNDNIIFGYDDEEKKHYIDFNELNQVGLVVNLDIDYSKTAKNIGREKTIFGGSITRDVDTIIHTGVFYKNKGLSELNLKLTTYYYNDVFNKNIKTEFSKTIKYNGGEIPITTKEGFDHARVVDKVLGLGNMLTDNASIIIEKNFMNYKKCRIYFDINDSPRELHGTVRKGVYDVATTEITGFNDNEYVKSLISSIKLKASTSAYDYELEEKKTTLLEFIEKAIFDYNFNSRYKVKLADDVKVLLDVVAKESEWSDYTLRELLVRAFKYVGISPILLFDRTITYSKTTKVSRYIDLELVSGKETEHLSDNYYDKVISTGKNIVSQSDLVKEILPVVSTETEFSRIQEGNAGFVSSNDIYYVNNAILYAPDLTISFGSKGSVNSNIDKPFYWDITRMLFEKDIYDSFPNVAIDYIVSGDELSPRSNKNLLTQGNTINYTSGSNVISRLFNRAERIPNYKWFDFITGTEPSVVPEFAIIEMLITLAFDVLDNPFGANPIMPDKHLKDIVNYTLELTYVPIFEELTTKYVSNMPNRKGLNWEKKMNLTDRVVSYQDNGDILRNEMEKKGNVKTLFEETHRNIADVIPYNSIVNDNLYITTRNMIIRKNVVQVEYILQENFILQNDDIRLPVSFERYNVPYEYVKREIMLENHLIFSRTSNLKYINEPKGIDIDFIKKTILNEDDYALEKDVYASMSIDDRNLLMRVAKLETDFTLILSGKFLDNYVAGIQRYEGSNDLFYTTPLSYTNANGKYSKLNNLKLGYSNNAKGQMRLALDNNIDYDLKLFPMGSYDGNNVNFNVNLLTIFEDVSIMKDAREQISFTLTNYLENEDETLKMYSFNNINKIGILNKDIYLNDDLKLENIDYSNYTDNFTFNIEQVANNTFIINFNVSEGALFENGIVLINETKGNETLVGVIKEPIINNNIISLFVATTRYGFYKQHLPNKEYNFNINNNNNFRGSYDINIGDSITLEINNNNKYDNEIDIKIINSLSVDIVNNNKFNVDTSTLIGTSINFNINNNNKFNINNDAKLNKSVTIDIVNNNKFNFISVSNLQIKVDFTINNTNKYRTIEEY